MQLEKPALFPEKKTFVWFTVVLASIICLRLFIEYHAYQSFVSKPFYYTYATVLNAYEKSKGGKRYQVLKLHSDEGFTFYTTSHVKDDFQNTRLRVQIFPSKSISFQAYLGTFYVKSRIKEQHSIPLTFKDKLLKKVAAQHENTALQSFYNAIFFATPLDKELRENIAMLGVSHLVALSGFHLGILWGLVYSLILLLYRPLQQRYFPYRHALFDVGITAMLLLGAYVWFVDFPPSLLRSYAMVLVGWMMLLFGVELLSFTFLSTIVFILVALFPSLLLSLSFGLSVAGVFYIFLLLQYTKIFKAWTISLLFIPVGIFMLMLPVVHGIFPVTSGYQLYSPLLSLLFIPFYPLVMILHLFGLGNMLDSVLLYLFDLPSFSKEMLLPAWIVGGYILLSLGAIWRKELFYLLLGAAFSYMVYLFLFV
ncbi:MAG: ComEC/Rec2 family competence protein [Epsilonproteobacteria bacterium]|nr:MAG: ComEC/Rec2 family competence protein [Campylobacterota bacterium]